MKLNVYTSIVELLIFNDDKYLQYLIDYVTLKELLQYINNHDHFVMKAVVRGRYKFNVHPSSYFAKLPTLNKQVKVLTIKSVLKSRSESEAKSMLYNLWKNHPSYTFGLQSLMSVIAKERQIILPRVLNSILKYFNDRNNGTFLKRVANTMEEKRKDKVRKYVRNVVLNDMILYRPPLKSKNENKRRLNIRVQNRGGLNYQNAKQRFENLQVQS